MLSITFIHTPREQRMTIKPNAESTKNDEANNRPNKGLGQALRENNSNNSRTFYLHFQEGQVNNIVCVEF